MPSPSPSQSPQDGKLDTCMQFLDATPERMARFAGFDLFIRRGIGKRPPPTAEQVRLYLLSLDAECIIGDKGNTPLGEAAAVVYAGNRSLSE